MAESNTIVKRRGKMKINFSSSQFTNTASNPILIDLDDDDEFPDFNNVITEDPSLDGTNRATKDEKETAGTDLTEIKSEVQVSQETNTEVEALLQDLTMDERVIEPQPIQGSTPKDKDFEKKPIFVVGSSSMSTRGTSRAQKLSDESYEHNIVAKKEETPDECILDHMPKDENYKKRKSTPDDSTDEEKIEVKPGVSRTRTSPRTLYETVLGLTEDQKEVLHSLGFGAIANMTTGGVPYRLAYFVVDSLDTSAMHLRVKQGLF